MWQVTFYAKGADSVMQQRIGRAEWMEEEVASLAREGLRTLVLACRPLSPSQLAQFQVAMGSARLGQRGAPASAVAAVWDELQSQEEMRLLAVTAVEDTLQTNVRAVVGIPMMSAADQRHSARDARLQPHVPLRLQPNAGCSRCGHTDHRYALGWRRTILTTLDALPIRCAPRWRHCAMPTSRYGC